MDKSQSHKEKTRLNTIRSPNQETESITIQAQKLAQPQTTDFKTTEDLRVKAMQEAAKTMGESLNNTMQDSQSCSWLMHQIRQIISLEEQLPSPHYFRFENTSEAAIFNANLIKNTDYDFIKTYQKQQGSIVTAGSEFRNIEKLKKLLSNHEDWKEFRTIVTSGCDYKLKPIVNEDTRKSDLTSMIERGNHKSATKPINFPTLMKGFEKEVRKGWTIPVTLDSIKKIRNLFIIPLGVAEQYSIDESGNRIPKKRITHDASFPSPSGDSVNTRTIDTLLQQCIYGQCLRRVIHSIHRLRQAHPSTKILLSKYDLDAAYRRLHVRPEQALQCVTIVKETAYIPLRLPFGVAAGPSVYSTISELIFDLTNDILEDKTWKRDKIFSPIKEKLSKPEYLHDSIPFESAHPLAVHVPLRTAFCDGYIDDFLSAGLDQNDEVARSQEAPTLAVHTIFRPLQDKEPIERDDPISIRKLSGEGIPSEKKIMLGWLLCTRSLRIYLPQDKELAWTLDINRMLKAETVNTKELESIVGRFNHIGYILPIARYFLNRLRHLLTRCQRFGKQKMKDWEINDLNLWKDFLSHATNIGVSFNHIAFTKHNETILTDASEYGIGGYNPFTGEAWRFCLPNWMHKHMHINLLEFIACTIGIWIETMKKSNKESFLKVKALTDNSSAVGWLYKSSFNPHTHKLHDTIARKLAKILLESNSNIVSQHTPGNSNIIADSLSRDFHLPEKKLTFILQSLYPKQMLKPLRILELPSEITSWLSSLRASLTKPLGTPARQDRSNTGTLFGGEDSWTDVVSKINSLQSSHRRQESSSSQRLRPVLEEMSLAQQERPFSVEPPSLPPSGTYVRSFGRTCGMTQL